MILILIFTVSCVGTVEDKNPDLTKGLTLGGGKISFDGIYDARAIANDKVEIYFYPSSVDARNVTYLISYDGLDVAKSVPGANLRPDYRGLLKYTVTGLEINNEYAFTVQAKNETGVVSSSTSVRKAKTFGNQTANFLGIGTVKNLPGFDGRTALRIEWPAAERIGSVFLPKEQDPVQYEIILLDADVATPVAFDDTSFVEPFRKVVFVNGTKISHQVNGLQPNTKYYIRVRAIHDGVNTYGDDPNYLAEKNNSYQLAATLSDDISSIDIDTSSFGIEIPRGQEGIYSLISTWKAAKGSFDHYRIYYKPSVSGSAWSFYKSGRDEVCNGEETNDSSWYCKEISFEKETYTITDLIPFTEYDIHLVVCGTKTCELSDMVEFDSNPPYKTNPGHVNFGGIEEIEGAKFYWSLNEIYLKMTPPDLNTGVADGILVELKERLSGPTEDTFLNHPTIPSGLDLAVVNFDYKSATEVTVSGVSLSENEPYCFALVPYYIDAGNLVENRSNVVTKCILPRVEAPTSDQFPGLSNAVLDGSTNTWTLNWLAPLGGVYSGFSIFVRTDGGNFLFSEAKAGDANYVRVNLPYGATSYQIPFLGAGTYKAGVLTYYNDGVTEYFSEPNTNVQTVIVGP